MGTVPTGALERELRKLYLQWLAGVPKHEDDTDAYLGVFEDKSRALITRMGGQVASLGALGDFPVPKTLELSPRAGVIYDSMKQAAISAGITAGLNSKDVARQMFNAGLDKGYKKLERLARTETVSAYWKNQWDSTADLPLIVMVWGSESSKRTCDYCLSRDGLVVEDGNIRDHPNGRCTLIPTLLSQLKYIGTLQPDGTITFDPKYGPVDGKPKPLPEDAQPTEAQKDPLSGKSNPAAPSKALAEHSPASGVAKPPTKIIPASAQPPVRLDTVPSVKQYAKDNLLNVKTLDKNTLTELDYYTGPGANQINTLLRGTKQRYPFTPAKKNALKESVKTIDSALKKSVIPEDVVVTRMVDGSVYRSLLAPGSDPDTFSSLAGLVIKDKGYMSTSLGTKPATLFANSEIQMEILVPKGSNGLYLAPISNFETERELLLPRGTNLAVQSVERKGKKWLLKVMVV